MRAMIARDHTTIHFPAKGKFNGIFGSSWLSQPTTPVSKSDSGRTVLVICSCRSLERLALLLTLDNLLFLLKWLPPDGTLCMTSWTIVGATPIRQGLYENSPAPRRRVLKLLGGPSLYPYRYSHLRPFESHLLPLPLQ
jgi:hypothetical protein